MEGLRMPLHRSPRARLVTLLIALAGVMVLTVDSVPSRAAFPGANGPIVWFKRTPNPAPSLQGLWSMKANGSDKGRILATDPVYSLNTSAEGDKLVWECMGICIANSDGTGMQNIRGGGAHDPSFTADGRVL